MKNNYKFLNNINFPSDLRKVSENDLQQVADEVREEMISAVSKTGGHLGAGLGVVELTVALHYVFDTPNDRLIWDVGHQAYPHTNFYEKDLIRVRVFFSSMKTQWKVRPSRFITHVGIKMHDLSGFFLLSTLYRGNSKSVAFIEYYNFSTSSDSLSSWVFVHDYHVNGLT